MHRRRPHNLADVLKQGHLLRFRLHHLTRRMHGQPTRDLPGVPRPHRHLLRRGRVEPDDAAHYQRVRPVATQVGDAQPQPQAEPPPKTLTPTLLVDTVCRTSFWQINCEIATHRSPQGHVGIYGQLPLCAQLICPHPAAEQRGGEVSSGIHSQPHKFSDVVTSEKIHWTERILHQVSKLAQFGPLALVEHGGALYHCLSGWVECPCPSLKRTDDPPICV